MSLYSRFIFPRLCDLLLRQPHITQLRKALLAHASGEILEIGFGTGLNLPCYPHGTRKISAVDPNPGMHRLALRRIERSQINVEYHQQCGEALPFAAATFDCAVSTFTLCSIDDVGQALRELHRVLRPGGKFLFLEHGLSPDSSVQRWQRRLNWLEQCLADGCRLDRDMPALVRGAGLRMMTEDSFYLASAPKTHGYLYRGVAAKPITIVPPP